MLTTITVWLNVISIVNTVRRSMHLNSCIHWWFSIMKKTCPVAITSDIHTKISDSYKTKIIETSSKCIPHFIEVFLLNKTFNWFLHLKLSCEYSFILSYLKHLSCTMFNYLPIAPTEDEKRYLICQNPWMWIPSILSKYQRVQGYFFIKVVKGDLIQGIAVYSMLGLRCGRCLFCLNNRILHSGYSYLMSWVLKR